MRKYFYVVLYYINVLDDSEIGNTFKAVDLAKSCYFSCTLVFLLISNPLLPNAPFLYH